MIKEKEYAGQGYYLTYMEKEEGIVITGFSGRVLRVQIPEQIDVFGFDCVNICTMLNPPIPVVHQPEQEIGRLAAMNLLERLGGYDGPARVHKLKCQLIRK